VHARAGADFPDDLPRIVDAMGMRSSATGHVDLGEGPTGVEETMDAWGKCVGISIVADDERGCGDDDNS